MLDVDRRFGRYPLDAIGADIDAAMHDRPKIERAPAEEPDVVLRPVIGIGIEPAENPVAEWQGDRSDSIRVTRRAQIGDRLRAQHLVIVEERDPLVATLLQRE